MLLYFVCFAKFRTPFKTMSCLMRNETACQLDLTTLDSKMINYPRKKLQIAWAFSEPALRTVYITRVFHGLSACT